MILDAVHAKREERDAVAALAAEKRVPFAGLWLDAPAEVMRERVASRRSDVSDAIPEVIDIQLGYDIGPQNFERIDAGRPLEQVVASCLERIGIAPRVTG